MEPCIARPEVTRHILKKFKLRASKRLGQNFLIDPGVVQEIVTAANIKSGDRVLEIGPGIGTLTQGLAEAGAVVTAVELDKKLPAVLAETLASYENIRVIPGDVLKIDILALMGEEPFKVVANLPYYITTPILLSLLERRLPIVSIVTMVQREVAERMMAAPGSKSYGSLSVAVQYYTEPGLIMAVPPRSFLPAPEVESAVVACLVRAKPAVTVSDEALFFRVVKAAFGQRRKTLGNALKSGFEAETVRLALERTRIDGGRRGETLSLQEFATLTDAISEAQTKE
ncbi:MAG: 16S rRNA (adenine(1518)-N(6)/adenine(1519)-N(6))-dimethyltransferase RsmA [Selenomonadaceae bacterium]|nr:16S rRNA (adenine(1518)-N(6)/adenine(1519)-N(6))-dimethyltransferase RsmA [Selenomonadaceae bacterium]